MTDVGQKKFYLLSDLIGEKVLLHGKKIGKLGDLIIQDGETLATVTHLYVSRSFGDPSLLIPWANVKAMVSNEIIVDIPDIKMYEKEIDETSIKLNDCILDKKVLDTEDRDVDVVYDIRLVLVDDRLFVCDVDISNLGLLRRLGLEWLGNLFGKAPKKKRYIPWKYVQSLQEPLDRFKGNLKLKILKEKLAKIHPVDLADILEELDSKQRMEIFEELGTEKASATLGEIDPKSQREIVSAMTKERIVQLFEHMTTGQIADVLASLPADHARPLISLLDEDTKNKIRAILEKQEQHVENLVTKKIIKCHENNLVGETQDAYAKLAKYKDVAMYLYIINDNEQLIGVIDIKELLGARRTAKLKEIMVKNMDKLRPKDTYRKATEIFAKYDFRAIPVVDSHEKLLGAVTYKDLMKFKKKLVD